MADSYGSSLPDMSLPEKQKDEKWYGEVAKHYLRTAVTGGFMDRYQQFGKDLSVYNLDKDLDDEDFWQTTEGGDVLPATKQVLSSIRVKINTVINELWGRGDVVTVRAINREAQSRALDARLQMHALIDIHDDLKGLEADHGIPTVPGTPFPPSRTEADKWFEENYKDISAKQVQKALDYLVERYQWVYTKYALFRDIKIHGCCFCENKIVSGVPRFFRRNPRKTAFDIFATDDFVSDGTFWGFVDYRPIADVISEHQIKKEEELNKLNSRSGNYGQSGFGGPGMGAYADGRLSIGNSQVQLYQTVGGERRVLEYTVYFKDTTTQKYKDAQDKHGNPHYKKVEDTYRLKGKEKEDGTKLDERRIAVWRKVTLIADDIVKNFGLCENMVRSVDDLGEAECPVKACIPGYLDARIVSLPSQVRDLEILKGRVAYKAQVEVNKAIGSVLNIDVDRIPKGYDTDWVIKNIRGFGINFYSSMKDGQPNNSPLLNPQDVGLSSLVEGCLQYMGWIDSQIELVTNITPARVGQIVSANQGLGVTQTAQQNSVLSTEHEYRLFSMFCGKVLNHLAGLVKLTFIEPDQWADIVGDAAVDFFRQECDVFLQDYGVFVKSEPKIISDEKLLMDTLTLGLQQGAFGQGLEGIVMFLKAALNANVRDFVAEAEKKVALDKADAQAHDAAMQQMQAEQAQQMQQDQLALSQQDTTFKENEKMRRQTANIDQRGAQQRATDQQKAALSLGQSQVKDENRLHEQAIKVAGQAGLAHLQSALQQGREKKITDKTD